MSEKDDDSYQMPEHGWTCFHCGETFTKPGSAADHFGDDPLQTPGCVLQLANGIRGALVALRKSERVLRRLADRNETLEDQLATAVQGYGRIAGAKDGHEAFMAYDTMEGRALAAEAIVADMLRRVPAMVDASRRRASIEIMRHGSGN